MTIRAGGQSQFFRYRVEAAQIGGVALSTRDTITFGFGLEHVDATTRNELVRRSLLHLLPTGADTTAPTVAYTYPADGLTATPRDPTGSTGPQGPQGPPSPPGSAVLISCALSSTGQSIVCEMSTSQSTKARIRSTVRLAGTRLQAIMSGKRGSVRLRLRSSRRIARNSRVVVRVKIAGRSARMTVPLGKEAKLTLKARR